MTYSATTKNEIHFYSELQALDARFTVDIRCTGAGDVRFTTEEILEKSPERSKFYIMGPKTMMDAFSTELLAKNMDLQLERWW